MTLGIMALSIMAHSKTTLIIITLHIMANSVMVKHSTTTHIIKTEH